MRRFISFGPALVVLLTTLVTLVAAPAAVRMIGYAQNDAQVQLARQTLEKEDILDRINVQVRAIAEAVSPSVVHIATQERAGAGRRGWIRVGQGSGWVFDDQGHIVTNSHVVRGAQQIVVPILAVGLCYGLESEAVSLIAKYILMFVSMRSAPDDAIRAAFCHHCENYIALMEYYAPSEHCMEATTRT